MKTNKIALLLIFLIFSTIKMVSQPKDYSDFYKSMGTFTDEKIYTKLLDFQKKAPRYVNIYAQWATVTHKLMHKSDPLKEFNESIKCADEGILYLSLFGHFMPDNEGRANKSYYVNLPINKEDNHYSNPELLNYSAKLTQDFKNYRDSLRLVYRALEQSKEYYGKSIALYKSLNNRFFSLNELLLQCNNPLIGEIKELNTLFDSTLFYFDSYTNLTKSFPLNNYHQKYELKQIKTFRLDGLSNSNFLLDAFEIWNFRSWVDEFLSLYQNEIIPLRQEITDINTWFSTNEKLLAERTISSDSAPKVIMDEKFIFKLGKYDNNSLVRELFSYHKGKYEYLKLFNDKLNSYSDSLLDLLHRKVRYYNDLNVAKHNADSLLVVFETGIKPERINRFTDLFNNTFGGMEGLSKFCTNQKNELQNFEKISYNNLKSYLLFLDEMNSSPNYIKYKNDSIPAFVSSTEQGGKFLTNDIYRISGKPSIISGYEISKTSTIPFACFIDNQNKIKWIKQIDKPVALNKADSSAKASKIYGYNGGCIALFKRNGAEPANILVKLDTTGRQVFTSTIQIKSNPVFVNYDDINQKTLIAFEGEGNPNSEVAENATVCLADSAGNVVWKTEFELEGNIVDIVRSENLYQVFINYKSYNINGTRGSANAGGSEWGLLVLNIDETGNIIKTIPLNNSFQVHLSYVIKLSGQSICLIGFKTPPGDNEGDLYFAIVNNSGKIIYSN